MTTFQTLIAEDKANRASVAKDRNQRTLSAHQRTLSARRIVSALRIGAVLSVVVVVFTVLVTR